MTRKEDSRAQNLGAKIHHFAAKQRGQTKFNPSHPDEEVLSPQQKVASGSRLSVGRVGECIEALQVVLSERILPGKKARREAELKFKKSPLGQRFSDPTRLWHYVSNKKRGHNDRVARSNATFQVHQVPGTHTDAQANMKHDPYPPKGSWRDIRGKVSKRIAHLKRRVYPQSQPPEIP
jgi:hypothetical protein